MSERIDTTRQTAIAAALARSFFTRLLRCAAAGFFRDAQRASRQSRRRGSRKGGPLTALTYILEPRV
jgi:hypothetical protein